ncbi:MAG: PAS domain S-box protein [Verrucomicrobiales bacterium]
MVSSLGGLKKPVSALVVEFDPTARQKICQVLTNNGIEVSACSSLLQGREFFDDQPIVMARSSEDRGELNGFVDWVRERSGNHQPYIVAISECGDGLDKMESAIANPGCDAVLRAPVEEEQIEERLRAIDQWLEMRFREMDEGPGEASEVPPVEAQGTAMVQQAAPLEETATVPVAALQQMIAPARAVIAPVRQAVAASQQPTPGVVPAKGNSTPTTPITPGAKAIPTPQAAPAETVVVAPAAKAKVSQHLPRALQSVFNKVSAPAPDKKGKAKGKAVKAAREAGSEENGVPSALVKIRPAQAPASTPQSQVVYSNILIENAPLAMAMFDNQMRYLVANRRWHKEFHLENVALAGRSHFEVFPNLPESWRALFERCLSSEQTERCNEDLYHRPDGTTDWVQWEVRPWRRADGAVGGLIVSSEVITERHLREQRSKFEGEFASSILKLGGAPAMVVDLTGRVVEQNQASEELFGPDCGKNPAFWDLVAGEEARAAEKKAFEGAVAELKSGGRFSFPVSSRHDLAATDDGGDTDAVEAADEAGAGAIVWSNIPQVNAAGAVEALIRVGSRIESAPGETSPGGLAPMTPEAVPVPLGMVPQQEWEAKEAALVAERDLYARIPDSAPFGIVLLDEKGKPIYSNAQHKVVLGFSIEGEEDVEAWLARGCPDEEYRREVIDAWRDGVWQKQLTKTFSLATGEGLLKEIEFRPRLLSDGTLLVSFLDVTEARRTEEAFRASEAKFKALFQGARLGMALVDRSGDFFDINSALEVTLGYPRWEMRRRSLAECVFPEDQKKLDDLVKSLLEDEDFVGEAEVRLVRKDSKLLWVRLNASPVRDHAGDLLFTVYTVVDISAQRKAKRDLRDSQEQNRALLEAIPDLIMLLDENAKVIDLIPSTRRHLALDGERVGREGFGKELPELSKRLHELVLEAHEKKHGAVRFEFSTTDEKDEPRQLEARIVSCGDRHTLVMVADVTDRQLVQETTRRQALAFENIDDAIVLTDLKGRITDFNPAAEKLFGYEKSEVTGEPLYMLYSPDNPREFNRRISKEINTNHRWAGETTLRHKSGKEQPCEVLYIPVEGQEGSSRALVGINRPAAQKQESLSGAAAKKASRSDIGKVHHRMKNDLQIISSLLNLQLASLPDRMGRKMLKENQNRILAISYIYRQLASTRNVSQIDFAEYVESLAQHLVRTFKPDSALVDVTVDFSGVSLDIETAVPLALIANELLSNALLHGLPDGRKGAIRIGFEEDPEAGKSTMTVSDNGVGLPMTFDLDDPATLGLQVVKILAEQLRGDVSLADSPENTTFDVRFPSSGKSKSGKS